MTNIKIHYVIKSHTKLCFFTSIISIYETWVPNLLPTCRNIHDILMLLLVEKLDHGNVVVRHFRLKDFRNILKCLLNLWIIFQILGGLTLVKLLCLFLLEVLFYCMKMNGTVCIWICIYVFMHASVYVSIPFGVLGKGTKSKSKSRNDFRISCITNNFLHTWSQMIKI